MTPEIPARLSRRSFAQLLGLGAAAAAGGSRLAEAATAASPAPSTAPSARVTAPHRRVRLDSNENPYGPPPSALAAIAAALPEAHRYPDGEIEGLVAAIAVELGVGANQVVLGAGSSQILHAAAAAFSGPGRRAVVPEPTFEALARYATAEGAEVVRVPLTSDHRHDVTAMARAADGAGLVYVCNPNNPTATVTPEAELRDLVRRCPPTSTILVDEAYHHFAVGVGAYASAVPWIAEHPNVVVARTFSKIYALAGLRCGFAVGAPEAIARIRKALPWDGVSLPAAVGSTAALADAAWVEQTRTENARLRASTAAALAAHGALVRPSAANFLFADLGVDVGSTIAALAQRGVDVGRRFPALPTHLRVTIGTEDEMDAFLAAFAELRDRAAA